VQYNPHPSLPDFAAPEEIAITFLILIFFLNKTSIKTLLDKKFIFKISKNSLIVILLILSIFPKIPAFKIK